LFCRSTQKSKTFFRFPTKQKPHYFVMGLFALDVVPPGFGCASSFDKPLLQMQKSLASQEFCFVVQLKKVKLFFVFQQNKSPITKQWGFLRLMWCLQESNQGHKDFQSFALPPDSYRES